MTVYGLIAALAWAGVFAYAVRRAGEVSERWLAVAYRPAPFVGESSGHSGERGATVIPQKVEIPDDLEAFAAAESEPWAQEDMRQVIREKFHEYKGDWQKVRIAVGIGELP